MNEEPARWRTVLPIKDSSPQILPFATVERLLVRPPSPAPFAAGTVFGTSPFPRACPARHWRRVLLAKCASISGLQLS